MLKELRLRASKEGSTLELAALNQKLKTLEERTEELSAALNEEGKTPEDITLIESQLTALEGEFKGDELATERARLEGEITRIDGELTELAAKRAAVTAPNTAESNHIKEETTMHRSQVRELLRTGEYYQRSEVKGFYEQIRNLRSVAGAELTIPEVVFNRIREIMGDYTTIYPLVEKLAVKGNATLILDSDTTPATWMDMIGAKVPTESVGTITTLEFQNFKVGKIVFVDNAIKQDSIINLDDYVTKKIARSIALALDKAILIGKGKDFKELTGIIPKLPEGHSVTVSDPKKLADLVAPIAKIDTGEDTAGNITAVMRRSTYYTHLLNYTVQVNKDGRVVGTLPVLSAPNILGIPVTFSQHMPENAILYGDFSKYLLVERESIVIDNSNCVAFAEDQTAFRGKGRYDGQPVKPEAFAMVTIGAPTADPPAE